LNREQTELCRRLQYTFADPALLERALTHRSRSADNYERLEFLGDSLLSLVISAELYHRFPDLTEGELTRLRASLVKKETLAAIARELELGDCLVLGGGEMKSGGFDRDSILADALEAVFGAAYEDRGIEAAQQLVRRLYGPYLERLDARAIPKDPKTRLQEHLQKQSLPVPIYNVLHVSGDPHNQVFIVECRIPDLALTTRGEGATRRAAEQQAASQALERLQPT
jgi:ribonuclease-3